MYQNFKNEAYMNKNDFLEFSNSYMTKAARLLETLDHEDMWKAMDILYTAKQEGRKIFFIGNGGSSSIASHFACDFGKGVKNENNPHQKHYRVISLDNVPWTTARANDGADYYVKREFVGTYNTGYHAVFVDQLVNLYTPGDILFAISSSGNSPNIVNAALWVKENAGKVIGLTGFSGGKVKDIADVNVCVETEHGEYGHVEGIHEVIHHLLYEYARKIEFNN